MPQTVLSPKPKLLVWKTIKLGMGFKISNDFRTALTAEGCCIGARANAILEELASNPTRGKTEGNLAVVSVGELGFKDGGTYADICKRALEQGLKLCPAEVGPQLRLQYADQPSGECLYIAMEPINTKSGADGHIFMVGHIDSE